MPADKSTDRLTAAEETFKSLILEQYDLESDFISAICVIFRKSVESLGETSGAPKRRTASTKPKKARKKSAYNVFVREMMKTDEIKDLDHKQKMGAIAKLWKELGDDERTPYTTLADEENNSPAAEE